MNSKGELAAVGVFVLIATALMIVTVLAVAGTFSRSGVPYHAYFKSAAGIVPGAVVRYGGMKAGRVETVHLDPHDSTRIEIDLTVGQRHSGKNRQRGKDHQPRSSRRKLRRNRNRHEWRASSLLREVN